jgi:ubiquinone/menaquinone biosynthesis C-methylase UbiE
MPPDKSLFYYGSLYHRLFDPPLAEARRVAVDLVAEGSSVLDVGCGTGQLCVDLRERKHCRVTGIDLSLRMLDFARGAHGCGEVSFLHLDATDLAGIGDVAFDFATILLLAHELPTEKRVRVLREALRVARAVLIIDSAAPLPWTPGGLGIRAVEFSFGHEHYRHFRDFLARGGIMGLLGESGYTVSVARRLVFWRKCREAVLVAGAIAA